MEMSRQRLRPSLGESSQIVCPRCEGHGRMRSVESLSLSILRLAEEHAMKENTGQVLVQAPTEIANYLLNEKRRALSEIEKRHDAPIVIVADDQLETPHYEVTRIRENELGEETSKPSYHRGTPRKLPTHALTKAHLNIPDLPAVTNVKPAQPAPLREPREVAKSPRRHRLRRHRWWRRRRRSASSIASWASSAAASRRRSTAGPCGTRQQDGRGRSDRTIAMASAATVADGKQGRDGRRDEQRSRRARVTQPRAEARSNDAAAKQQRPARAAAEAATATAAAAAAAATAAAQAAKRRPKSASRHRHRAAARTAPQPSRSQPRPEVAKPEAAAVTAARSRRAGRLPLAAAAAKAAEAIARLSRVAAATDELRQRTQPAQAKPPAKARPSPSWSSWRSSSSSRWRR